MRRNATQLDEILAREESPYFELYLCMPKSVEVLIYRCDLKVTSVSDPVEIFTNKL